MKRRLVVVAAALVMMIAVTFLLDRYRRELDVTADRTLSLTTTSLDVVRDVESRARVTAFLSRREPGRAEAAALLDRYSRANRNVTFRLLDPADAPGELRRLGVDPALGGVAVEHRGRVERAPTVSEQDITAALARVVRDVEATVCFTAGHGERPLSGEQIGFSGLASLLEENGYAVMAADTDFGGCTVAVVAAPTAAVPADDPLVRWLHDEGGRALVLTDPESQADVAALLAPFGITVRRGVVVERNPSGHVPGDPATPVVAAYRSGFPFVRRLPPTVYPGAQGLSVGPAPREGVAAAVVAQTTSGATLEGAAAVEAPVGLVAAADASRVDGGRVTRSRVVATGDVDLLSNAFLGELGHGLLAVQAVDWLALDEDLVSVSANLPRARPLLLTEARLTYLRALMAGVVPLAFLLAGAGVWAVRRSR